MDEYKLKELGLLILDLDRCEHGRHAKDDCWMCPEGWSSGNKFLTPGQRIGTTLTGLPIIVPTWSQRNNPAAWVANE